MEVVIRDEKVIQRLQEIAEREQVAVENAVNWLLEHHPEQESYDVEQELQRLQAKFYAEARAYWSKVGDSERLALTDAELDEQFWLFDAEDIPRLKSDQGKVEIPEGSGVMLAQAAERFGFYSDDPLYIYENTDDILNAEFADYLLARMRLNDDPNEILGR